MIKMQSYDSNEKVYNETYLNRNKKYTLNIPNELYVKAKEKARKAGIYRVSIYIRALLEREVNKENSLNMEEILEGRKESLRIASAEHRREKMDTQTPSWVKLKIRSIQDIFQPKQSIFDFNKNNS